MFLFSDSLIKEYQEEMQASYGVFVDSETAQTHLRALARSMFPTDIAEENAESRELGASEGSPTCTDSLSATMPADGGNEVGASITPTSRHRDKSLIQGKHGK